MEYQVAVPLSHAQIAVLRDEARSFDPAAVLDYDMHAGKLRIATVLLAVEVKFLLEQAGHAISLAQVETLPSVCCGGCSG